MEGRFISITIHVEFPTTVLVWFMPSGYTHGLFKLSSHDYVTVRTSSAFVKRPLPGDFSDKNSLQSEMFYNICILGTNSNTKEFTFFIINKLGALEHQGTRIISPRAPVKTLTTR